MLDALELLHYSARFAGQLFAFCFDSSNDFHDLFMDLRVLHASSIRQVLFCAADNAMLRRLDLWNQSGHSFLVLEPEDHETLQSASFIGKVQRSLSAGHSPLIVVPKVPGDDQEQHFALKSQMIHCAVALGATKVFFPGPVASLKIAGRTASCPTPEQLEAAFADPSSVNVPVETLRFFVDIQKLHGVEVVWVEDRRGGIFSEVFTHSGSGTLFTSEYPNILRPAEATDVMDMLALMQPYIKAGTLKKMTEDELLSCIGSFTVFTINKQIVALAALLEHEDCYELAKLCTLPRYQAKGRARKLVRELQKKTKEAGKRGVFALTVSDSVGDFFQQMDFEPCAREELPDSWKAEYDFSRPSKAYWYQTN